MPDSSSDRANPYQAADLVVIDATLADWPMLAAAAPDGARVLVIEPCQDGFSRLADHLAVNGPAGAVHVLGHGAPDWRCWVPAGCRPQRWIATPHLVRHRRQLGPGGAILFYACALAGSDEGAALIDSVADIAGVAVAASIDRTGAGGNWRLDYRAGTVEASVIAADAYPHALAEIAGSTYTATTATGELIIAGGGGGGGQDPSPMPGPAAPGRWRRPRHRLGG